MKVFLLLGFVLIAAGQAGASPPPAFANSKNFMLPFQVTNGTSTAEILSVDSGLDDPKMTRGVNDSTFDWWHFSVVGRNRSLSVVLYNFGESSLDVLYPGGPLLVQVSGTFENGTSFLKSVAATEGATFDSLGPRGISSAWYGKNDSVYYFAGGPFYKPEIPLTLGFYGNDIEVYGAIWLTPVRLNQPKPNEEPP
ncbi:hypothetical protein FJTKL_01374 [Diaporthe vaccinii]|uniref:Diels-Alderase N-terminal domain-containing protein n=1 Tax=Diaporthe vaccinii TaxID=105482 RepID=A0ABR4E0Z4_9PEZI